MAFAVRAITEREDISASPLCFAYGRAIEDSFQAMRVFLTASTTSILQQKGSFSWSTEDSHRTQMVKVLYCNFWPPSVYPAVVKANLVVRSFPCLHMQDSTATLVAQVLPQTKPGTHGNQTFLGETAPSTSIAFDKGLSSLKLAASPWQKLQRMLQGISCMIYNTIA